MFAKQLNNKDTKEKNNAYKEIDIEKLKEQQIKRAQRQLKKQKEKISNISKEKNNTYKEIDIEKLKEQQIKRAQRQLKKQKEKINNISESEKEKYYINNNNQSKIKQKELRVNKRAKFSEYNINERKHIYERDKGKCVYCSGKTYLGIAHIFASRTKGGKGCRENGVLLCQICHNSLDNGKDEILKIKIKEFCETYLINIYGNIDIDELLYKKDL